MKKRILLILVVGVSFAPPVFASTDLSTYRPNIAYTGEQGENDIDHRGTQCEIAEIIRKEAAEAPAPGRATGVAGVANGG